MKMICDRTLLSNAVAGVSKPSPSAAPFRCWKAS